ncbi:hypothetical protein CHARACLAT_009483 [Characodon lateralis]|uniref:Uncharacterized protein n=1 Tax=Characodon lateralis TaxID=208331 RepID=A0ABU7ETV0_9TELE|nr:hypothetical protein [Characodon lateralis]
MDCKQSKSRIPYRNKLNSISRQRYLEKIQSVNGLDPYEHIEWTSNQNDLPEVTLLDVFDYHVCGVSAYTQVPGSSSAYHKRLGAGSSHLPWSGNRGSSLSRETQTSLFPATWASLSGGSPRHSQASRET